MAADREQWAGTSSRRPVLVRLPAVLVALFPGADRLVEIEAETIDEMIDALDERWPGMRDRICDSMPSIRKHINVFVDGERSTLASRLEPGADVFVFTAMSGG
ncbi:MAG TPA: MoaD/ThiS family protein [Pararhizobium sp.]|nr:MoaD/ThiS family protein [Pararhizobium sp.]